MQHLYELRQLIRDLNTIPRLSNEELHHLTSNLAAARQGRLTSEQAAQARARLIEGYLWLVVSVVRRSPARLCTLSPLDLVQEGTFGLFRALDRFDFASGGNFTAYAAATIRYAILNALPMENIIRVSYDLTWRNCTDERIEALRALQPLSLDALHGEEDCSVGDLLAGPPLMLPEPGAEEAADHHHAATHMQVEALLSRLSPREQQVLRLRYGLDEANGRAHSLNEIARHLGLNDSTVCTIIKRALQKLREPQRPPVTRQQQQARVRQEQTQRLEAAGAELERQGIAPSVKALARQSHVDKAVVRPFVHDYWIQQGSEQERLRRAYTVLEMDGLPITLANLCSRAHVEGKVAASFLQSYQPSQPRPKQPPQQRRRAVKAQPPACPKKAPPEERLAAAFARLQAHGEPITRTYLRREAGVGTDAARQFLRAQRQSDSLFVPQS